MKTQFQALVLTAVLSPVLFAQHTFTGVGNWTDPARWDTGIVPPDNSTAIVNGEAEITENVVAEQNRNAARVEIGSGAGQTGTLTVSGGTLSGAHGGGQGIFVGLNGGTGTLIVEEGAEYRSQGANMRIVIGDLNGGTGTISVAGRLQNYKMLEINNGTLQMMPTGKNDVFNEAQPSFIGANGTLAYVIDGPNVGALERSNTNGLQMTIDSAATLSITLEGAFAISDSWVLMSYATLSGQFAQGTTFTNQQGYTFDVDYGSGSLDVITLTLTSDDERPKIDALSASPPSISSGQMSTISWTASNFDSLVLDPGGFDVTADPNKAVTPTATTTYTLSATLNGVTVTRDVTVVVDELPEINEFNASELVIAPGGSTTLAWDVSGADTITIDPEPGAVGAVDSASVMPAATTTYTLTATNGTGPVTKEVTVVVDAIESALIHRWDPAAAGQTSGALLDSVGGKNFDITGGNLLTELTSPGSSLTAAMSRVNLNAGTGGDNGLGFPLANTTYELWVTTGVLDERPQVIFETGGPGDGSCVLISASGARFLHSSGGANTIDIEAPITLVNPNDVMQIAVSLDGNAGQADLYVRGAGGGDSSATGNGVIGVSNGRGSILTWSGFGGAVNGSLGGTGGTAPAETTTFKGTLGFFKIYDRPFSAAEVEEAFLLIGNEIIDGDADNDMLPDYWENEFFGDLSQGPTDDSDGDSLVNADELTERTDPSVGDTDGDGLTDGEEVNGTTGFVTSPINPDTDGDGFGDGFEIQEGSDPTDISSVPGFNPIDFSSGPFNITGALTDIDLTGTLVHAWNGGSATVTVGGIDFVPGPSLGTEEAGRDPIDRGGDADYEILLDSRTWNADDQVLVIPGLTPGADYQIQIWTADTLSTFGELYGFTTDPGLLDFSQIADLEGGDSGGSFPAQSVIGTFTADGTSQSIQLYSTTSAGSMYSAIMVRQTSNVMPGDPVLTSITQTGPTSFELSWTEGDGTNNIESSTDGFQSNIVVEGTDQASPFTVTADPNADRQKMFRIVEP